MKYSSLIAVIAFLVSMVVLVSCNSDGGQRDSATRSASYVVEGGVARGKVWRDIGSTKLKSLLRLCMKTVSMIQKIPQSKPCKTPVKR